MMTQSDVLELAKQGNPQAIASLMNLVLQPKGVTVKASLQNRCLHILFASAEPLSQSALGSFARTGLANLGGIPIDQVKLYAQKTGEKTPIWTDEFQLGTPAPAPVSRVVASPTLKLPRTAPRGVPTLPTFTPTMQSGAVAVEAPPIQQEQEQAQVQEQEAVVPTPPPRLPKKGVKRPKNRWQFYLQKLAYQIQHGNRYVLATVVGLGAFAIGGTVAILIYSHAYNQSQVPADLSAVPSGNSLAGGKPSAESQQAYVRNYLMQMNKAQQNFYKKNSRFATSLEELERSAALISQSSGYTYKLILPNETQSVVTAIPKSDNLKSYAGTVVLTRATTQDWPTSAIVCETNKPSTVAPVLPQALDGPIQCPVDSSAVH